ncbi:MAG: sensor histidine kinase [Desertimonas sp.]
MALRDLAARSAGETVEVAPRFQEWWRHIAFAAIVSFVAVAGATSATRSILAVGALVGAGLLVGGYLRWGIAAIATGNYTGRYCIAAIAGTILLALATDAAILLAAVVVPQLFWLLPIGTAFAASAVVFVALGISYVAHRSWDAGAWGIGAALTVGGFVSSGVLAIWLSRVLSQNEVRARLITELETTRDELAQLHHDTGVLEERARLAGEIHDSLTQGFVSIHLLLATVERDLTAGRLDRALERTRLARDQASHQLHESRSIVAALGPVDLASGQFAAGIRTVAERFGRELGVAVEMCIDVDEAIIDDRVSAVLLRTLQESLSNVRKHAQAQTVSIDVSLGAASSVVHFVVEDDGRGFDHDDVDGGFGLSGLDRRLRTAGGTLQVTSTPEVGTTVTADVPIRPADPNKGAGEVLPS